MAWCAGIGYGNAILVAEPRALQPAHEEGLYTASLRGVRGSEKEVSGTEGCVGGVSICIKTARPGRNTWVGRAAEPGL